MSSQGPQKQKSTTGWSHLRNFRWFRSSIYSRVILVITGTSVFLFVSFGIIFRSVHEQYLNTAIRQNGNNIGSLVEGALYHSMLKNDKSSLQNTLDVINTMSGIDDVSMYNHADSLVYSSFTGAESGHGDLDCAHCHGDMSTMFPGYSKSYRIIDENSTCGMIRRDIHQRHLVIKSPILNERSCYTSSCHAHQSSDTVLGSLIINIPLRDMDGAVQKASTDFYWLATFTTLLLVSLLIFFTTRKIKNPLNEIVLASREVANGNRTTRLEIKPGLLDDIRVVSVAFNNMLDNLHAANVELQNWSQQLEYKVQKNSEELRAAQNELIHIERIASLGKLSSSVAHEINNPLSGVLTYTKLVQKQLARAGLDPVTFESIMKHLKVIETETKRIGQIVKGLLDFSREGQENFEPKPLNRILADTAELISHQMKMANILFSVELNALNDQINCNENQVKQALMAILVNASEAIMENGEIFLRTSNPDEDHVRIEVADNGVGISPADLPHIFEPFFSGKHKESGIGLGLAIAHGIVKSHQGKIEAESKQGRGTTISILLPLSKNEL